MNVDLVNAHLETNVEGYNRLVFKGNPVALSKINKSLFINCVDLAIQKVEVLDKESVSISENMSYGSMVETYLSSIKTDLDMDELKKLNSAILEAAANAN